MQTLYFDFEYRDNEVEEALALMSWMTSPARQPEIIDLRSSVGRSQVRHLVNSHQDHVWIAYNAQADLKCLLALGIDIQSMKVVDAMAEARMVTLTHRDYWAESQSLLASLKAFGVKSESNPTEKEHARDLILSHADYSPKEWDTICRYGPTDITPLPSLMTTVSNVHQEAG